MGSTSPTQARTACSTSDFAVAAEPFFVLVERLLPPMRKLGFPAEDERTRHCADVHRADVHCVDAARSQRGDESTAIDGDRPG